MENQMLQLVNKFLAEKGKPTVGYKDPLYSSGLLDSMEMVELMLFLEEQEARVNVAVDGTNFVLDSIDSAEKLDNAKVK